MFAVLSFAVALSMDGLAMGFSYGLRKIRIPFSPLLVICLFSAGAIIFSMTLGVVLAFFLPERGALFLGAFILIGVGFWIILQQYWVNRKDCLLFNILQEPAQADLNRSGEIDLREAFFLGLALAMDALGAGLGAAMSGYDLFLTAFLVGLTEFLMINLGILMGKHLKIIQLKRISTWLPGGIIVILGLLKLYKL